MALDWDKIDKQKDSLDEFLSKGGGGAGRAWWKPDHGDNRIRIMPGWTTEGDYAGQFWREVAQHWGLSDDHKGPVICPKKTPLMDGECPVCALVTALKKDKTNTDALEAAKDIRAKVAYFLNVVNLEDPEYTAKDVAEFKKSRPDGEAPFAVGDTKVQVYACPSTVFSQILSTIKVNQIDVTDLEDGHDITIQKTGKGFKTRYQTNIILKSSKAPAVPSLPPLDKVGFDMGYQELVDLLAGGVGADFAKVLPATSTEEESDNDVSADDLRGAMQAALSS